MDLDVKEAVSGLAWWATFVEVYLGGLEPETWRARSGGGLYLFPGRRAGSAEPSPSNVGVDYPGKAAMWWPPSVIRTAKSTRYGRLRAVDDRSGHEAPVELTQAVDRLRLEHGGQATGPHERTASGETKNAFGRDIDMREAKLAALAWALVVDMRRESRSADGGGP